MTPAEFDEWIIEQADTHDVMEKMHDRETGRGVGVMYFVFMLIDMGMKDYEAYDGVRNSLVRLLRAGRIQACGINGWTTAKDSKTTPERVADRNKVIAGEKDYTVDLRRDAYERP